MKRQRRFQEKLVRRASGGQAEQAAIAVEQDPAAPSSVAARVSPLQSPARIPTRPVQAPESVPLASFEPAAKKPAIDPESVERLRAFDDQLAKSRSRQLFQQWLNQWGDITALPTKFDFPTSPKPPPRRRSVPRLFDMAIPTESKFDFI